MWLHYLPFSGPRDINRPPGLPGRSCCHGEAVVTDTGMRTEMGPITGLLEATPDGPTPLQRELDRTGKRLGLVVLTTAVVMIGLGGTDRLGLAAVASAVLWLREGSKLIGRRRDGRVGRPSCR